jgi:diguanylate cyclase (GGDEF)-like protein
LAFALVLLLSQRKSSGAESAAALAGSAALLALSITPIALGNNGRDPVPLAYDVATVAGWGFLAFSSLRIATSTAGHFAGPFADPASARLRQSVAPIVALVMAAAVLDGSFRPPIRESTAIALGVLGVVLALRVSHLLEATKNRNAERRQLAQSRALIEVSQALAGTTELDETLEMVTRWACRLLNAKAAGIELLSDDGETLEFRAGVGFPTEFIGLRFPVNDSFTGRVVLEGRTRVEADSQAVEDMSLAARTHLARSPIASAPLRYRERILGVLSCVGTDLFDEGDLELLGAMADQAALAIENARLFQQVHTLSKLDPLTGLSNRRQFEHDLDREFAAARRGRRLIAVMFDLNEFKEYNDRFGHLAGDAVLRAFGDVLRTETRSMNHAARYGGDEFIVLLTEADRAGARIFTEGVRRRFQRASARLGRASLNVAAGFAEFAPYMATADDLVAAADRAMYQAKGGRSRAV